MGSCARPLSVNRLSLMHTVTNRDAPRGVMSLMEQPYVTPVKLSVSQLNRPLLKTRTADVLKISEQSEAYM